MPSTYSNLKIELIAFGEQLNTWGTTTNNNLGTAIEQAISGYGSVSFTSDADVALSYTDTNASQTFRNLVLNLTSTVSLTATRNLAVPVAPKLYYIFNNTTGGQSIVVKTASGTGITVANGAKMVVYCDGTNVVDVVNRFSSLSTGSLTLGTALPIASGGTNATATPTAGAVSYGTGTAYAFTPAGTVGQVLQSNASGVPSWGNVVAGTNISVSTALGSITVSAPNVAPLASPALTGTPTAPTATAGTSTTQIATTAFVDNSFAKLNSPAFTGTPTAPTATAGTSTTQIATTAFVAATSFSTNLPGQTGNAGKFLTTDGTNASWGTSNYPTIRPSLLLDFANTRQLDPRITFTRASTATYYDAFGVLRTAAVDTARFDNNPATGESLGLLIEEQRTNLVTYSEQFDNAAWTKYNATVTADATTAPNGTTTADKLVENTATDYHFAQSNTVTPTASTSYTFSCYAKLAERTQICLIFLGAGNGDAGIIFSLTDGSYVSTINSGITNYNSQSVGNGWYRFSITWTASTTALMYGRVHLSNAGSIFYTGNGTSGIFIWGAQLEAGAFPTSYIPTVASQVTRSADAASMTGANFSSWYRADEGTVYAETSLLGLRADGNVAALCQIDDGTTANGMSLRFGTILSGADFYAYVANVPQVDTNSFGVTANVSAKYAYVYKLNDYAFTKDAVSPFTDTSATVPVVNRMLLAANLFCGTIKKLAYYPARVPNAQLQGVTTV